MDKSLIATSSIAISASPARIWAILTEAHHIKVYLFGTEVITDWEIGSPVLFQGEYQGTAYKDKGTVTENALHSRLAYTYWSGFSGLEDAPENYSTVTYLIEKLDSGSCQFTWHQQGFSSEEGKCHTQEGLKAMLEQIKELAEGK